MSGYVAKRVEDKVPLPIPIHMPHPRLRTKFRETTRFYQLALFLIPLGTLFIAIGVFVPRWLDVQVVNFVTLKEDYSIGLWEKCDTLADKCTARLESTLKGASILAFLVACKDAFVNSFIPLRCNVSFVKILSNCVLQSECSL